LTKSLSGMMMMRTIKSAVDAVSKNTINEESGKGKGYGKPAMVDISNVVMSNMENEADIINATTLNSEYEAAIQVHQGMELNMNKKHKTRDMKDDISDAVVPKHGNKSGTKVYRGRECKKPGTREGTLKTNHKDRSDKNRSVNNVMNNADAPIEDLR
jgi:hypothetical protein